MEQDTTKLLGIFKKNPQDQNTFKSLEQCYFLANAWEDLARLYQIRAQVLEKNAPNEAAQLYFQQGDCLEKRLGQPNLALDAFIKAYSLYRDEPKFWQAAIDIAESTQNWTKLAEILKERLPATNDRAIKVKTLLKLSMCYKENIRDFQQAKLFLKQVLDVEDNLQAIQMLENIYISEKSWESLVDLYHSLAQRNKDKKEKVQRLQQAAQISYDKLQSIPQTIDFYEEIIKINPQDLPALRKLEALFTHTTKWDKVIAVMQKQLELNTQIEEKIRILNQIALVCQKTGDYKSSALYYEKILQLQPDQIILNILEETYRYQEDWTNLVRIHQQQSEIAADSNEKVKFYCQLGELYEQKIKNLSLSISWYQKAFQESPQNLELLHKLQDLYQKNNDFSNLLKSLRQELDWPLEQATKISIYEKMVALLTQQNQLEECSSVYEEMLLLVPANRDIYQKLGQLYQKLKQTDKQLNILVRWSSQVTGQEKVDVYLQITKILEELTREKEAVSYYQKILEIDPNNLTILRRLKQYYTKENSFPLLIQTITRIIALDKQEIIPGYLEIARCQQEKLKDPAAAIATYQKLLQNVPDHLDSMRGLAKLYHRQQQWNDYITIAERLVTLVVTLQERLELHYALAQALGNIGQSNRQKTHLRTILLIKPDEINAIQQLKDLHRKQQNWLQLIEVLEIELRQSSETANNLAKQYNEIAKVYQQIEDTDNAILYYEKALCCYPQDLEAIRQLEVLYKETQQSEKLAQILQQHAELASLPEASDCLYQAALLYESCEKKKTGKSTQISQESSNTQSIILYRHILENMPTHREALEHLENLLRNANNFEELSHVYDRLTQLLRDPQYLIELHVKAGSIGEEHLQDINYAIRHYQSILMLDQGNQISLKRLIELYRVEQRWIDLVTLYHLQLTITKEQEEITQIWYELAQIYANRLNNVRQAVGCYREILKLDNGHRKAILGWCDLCEKNSLFKLLVEGLEHQESITTQPKLKKEILKKIVALCQDNPQKAIELEKRILEITPNDLESIINLHQLYQKTGQITELASLIQKEIELTTEPERQIELLIELTDIQENRLHDTSSALKSLEQLLTIDVQNVAAYNRLEEIYQNHQNWDELLQTLQQHSEFATGLERLDILVKIAILLQKYKNDEDAACKILAQVVAEQSENWNATNTNIPYINTPINRKTAVNLLATLYTKRQEWLNLIGLYEQELSLTQDPQKQNELHLQIAETWEKMSQYEETLKHYQSYLTTDPNNLAVLRRLEEVYQNLNKPTELAATLKKELELTTISKQRRIAILLRTAEVQEIQLANLDAAKENYLTLLELDTDNNIVLKGLERIYRQTKEYKALQNILEKELEKQKDPIQQKPLLWEISELRRDKFGNITGAIQTLEQLHKDNLQDLNVIAKLLELYQIEKKWAEYAKLLEEKIILIQEQDDPTPYHRELVTIYRDHLQQNAQAIIHAEAILKLHTDDIENILALESLYKEPKSLVQAYIQEANILQNSGKHERLVFLYREIGKIHQQLEQKEESVVYYQKAIALNPNDSETLNNLVELLSQQQKWQELLNVYETLAIFCEDSAVLENLHIKIAVLQETQFNDVAKAMNHYQIAYKINPENIKTIKGLRNLFQKQQRWPETIELLERECKVLEEDSKRAALYFKIGDIWGQEMKVPHKALESFSRILAQGFHRPTAEKMMELQNQLQDYRGFAEVLEKELRASSTKTEGLLGKLLRLGDLYWKKLQDLPNAARIFDIALSQDKQNKIALDSLEKILEELKRYPALIEVLQRKLTAIEDPQAKFQLQVKIAEIYRQKLHLGNEAMAVYENALALQPQCMPVLHKLQEIYEEWGQFEKLVLSCQQEISMIKDTSRIVDLYHKMGRIWSYKLFDSKQSIAIYQKLRTIAPNDRQTLVELAELFQRQERWPELLGVLQEIVQYSRTNHEMNEEIQAWLQIGRIQMSLGHKPEAISAYQHVLELEEYNEEAFTNLEKLYLTQKSFHEVAKTLEEKVEKLETQEAKIDIYLTLGKIYEQNLKNLQAASSNLEKVLLLQNSNLTALQSLHRIYEITQQWTDFSRILTQEIAIATDPIVKADLCYTLAMISSQHLNLPSQALQNLTLAVQTYPQHTSSLIELGNLAESEEKWQESVQFWKQAIEIFESYGPKETSEQLQERSHLYLRLGEIYYKHLDKFSEAIEMYQKAIKLQPNSITNYEAICSLYFSQNQWTELEPMLSRLISLLSGNTPIGDIPANSTANLAEWYYRWGICATALNCKDDAISRHSQARKLNPKQLEPILAIAPLYIEKQYWTEAYENLTVASQNTTLSTANKFEILSQLALVSEKLEKYTEAINHYQSLLKLQPVNQLGLVLASLARLYGKMDKNEESLSYYNQVLESTMDDDSKSLAQKDKAALLVKMGRYNEAIEEYTRVFEYNPQDTDVVAALANLTIKHKDWEQAEHWNQQHYQLLKDVSAKVSNRCQHAIILSEGLKRYDEAIAAYQEALDMDVTCLEAVEGIGNIYVSQKDWQSLAKCYQNFLAKLPVNQRHIGFPIHLALGYLLSEQLNDVTGAIREFEKVLELDPSHNETQIALTELKSNNPEMAQDAIKGHLKLLQKDQFRTNSYRALGKLLLQENQKDRAMRAYNALGVLEPAFLHEQNLDFSTTTRNVELVPDSAIMPNLVPSRIHSLFQLMALTDATQEKTYPPYIDKAWGQHIGKLSPQPPVWYYANKIMKILGLKDKQMYMYIKNDNTVEISIENTNPPSLIISQRLLDIFNESELNFILAKYLFYITQKQSLAFKLSTKLSNDDLELYFKLLRNAVQGVEPAPQHRELQKQIAKGLSGSLGLSSIPNQIKTRPELLEATTQVNVSLYLKCLEYSANRLALLITNSLDLSIQMLCRLNKIHRGERLEKGKLFTIKEMQECDGVPDLLHFNISEQYMKIRKLCGLSDD